MVVASGGSSARQGEGPTGLVHHSCGLKPEEAKEHAERDEGDHEFVEVVSGRVDKDGNVVVDEVVTEVDNEGHVVATDETIVVETPEGDIVVDETFSVADQEGDLHAIQKDVTVLEAGDREE